LPLAGEQALSKHHVGIHCAQGIIVPPIKALPAQGYTFTTWVRFEAASVHTQAEAPTLFRYCDERKWHALAVERPLNRFKMH
jgi:hypothetical protein